MVYVNVGNDVDGALHPCPKPPLMSQKFHGIDRVVESMSYARFYCDLAHLELT